MPFEDNEFDFVLCRAAFKNFSEPVAALREMHRVLKPGGKALIIDLRRDTPVSASDRRFRKWDWDPSIEQSRGLFFEWCCSNGPTRKSSSRRLVAQTAFRNVAYRTGLIEIEVDLHK